jgi:hypothetical protein
MKQGKTLSKETIKTIREQVLNGTSKTQVARDFNITYSIICHHTRDIRIQIVKSKELIDKIREEVKNGKTKFQVAQDHNLSRTFVYGCTKDIPSRNCGWPGIRGKTLDLLQEIMTKGYIVPEGKFYKQHFSTLQKYFPTIYRIKIYNRQIFLLKGKEDVALRAFLEKTNKKIISYQELRQVTKFFGTDISQKEKKVFLFKKRGGKGSKNKGIQKEEPLRENDDSFSFFCIRRY